MGNVVLMSRVSSDEQAKGYSLDIQLDALKKYCEKKDYSIVKVFKEDFSAKTFNRPGFNEFLAFAKANKGKIDYLLFTTWDRFSRNIAEAYEMIGILRKLGIEPRAIEQPLDVTVPENKIILACYLVLPEIDNDRRSLKVIGGIRAAWKAGRYIGRAPIGYINTKDENNKPLLKQGPNANVVKYIFEEVSRGATQREIRRELEEKQIRIGKSKISVLLHNTIYISKIFIPSENGEPSYFVNAIHEPIISQELFYSVQNILSDNKLKKNRPQVVTRREELLLRGIISCSKCNSRLTGSPSRSKTGRQYYYYHCNHCRSTRFRADEANDKMKKIISYLTPSVEVVKLYSELLKEALHVKTKSNKGNVKIKNDKLITLQNRLNNLQDLLADKKISSEEYFKLKSKYENELVQIKNNLSNLVDDKKDIEELVERSVSHIKRLDILYQELSLDRKLILLSSIFPENIVFENKKCRTPRINEAFLLYLSIDKGFQQKKTEQLSEILELSRNVARAGIEPAFPP